MGHKVRPHTADKRKRRKGRYKSAAFAPPRMTAQARAEFVQRYCDGAIFTAAQVPRENDLPMVFMPLALGALAGWPKKIVEQIGTIYESMHKALPRSVNGLPIFGSMTLMHRDDWRKVQPMIRKELARRAPSIEGGPHA
jgi:hypothetical protein